MNGRILCIYRQIAYQFDAPLDEDVNGNHQISIELVQNLIFSLFSLPPENQIFVSLNDFCVIGSFHENMKLFAAENAISINAPLLSFGNIAQPELRLLLLDETASSSDPICSDYANICTRCVFGDVSVFQPVYRSTKITSDSQSICVMCRACAQSCTTASKLLDPLEWHQMIAKNSHPSFISSVITVSGDSDVTAPQSYIKLPWDLNIMGSGPSVFLCVQRDKRRALTSIDLVEISNCQIQLTSEVVPLCRNNDAFGITDVRVLYGKDAEIPKGYIRSSTSMMSDNFDVYLCYQLAPLSGFVCNNEHSDIGKCLFSSRFSTTRSLLDFDVSQWLIFLSIRAARLKSDREMMQIRYKEKEPEMLSRLHAGLGRVLQYEDPSMQQAARMHIPIERLKRDAALAVSDSNSSMDEALVRQLLHWFKAEFFTWTNQPKCSSCGNEKTRYLRTEGPQSDDEIQGNASRVEIYECDVCHGLTRFPRYNNPIKLLSTRTGRCGEWANCFTLCCRAMGFDARYVLDVTDHVWTEVYSTAQNRWLHCDSCEDQLDAPLTYEVGWGKNLSYIFAFSKDQVVDVARRYTKDWESVLSRRVDVPEEWLEQVLERLNVEKQSRLSACRIATLKERHVSEQRELHEERKKPSGNVQGRVSGSAEWKRVREEDGLKSTFVDHGCVKLISRLDSIKTVSVQHVAKELCQVMTIGCKNPDCVNPYCFHLRKQNSDFASYDATDMLVRNLQSISAVSGVVSAAGISSLLCSEKSDIRSVILRHSPSLYLPMQDELVPPKCMLVDISGKENHVENIDRCPMRKPFRLYSLADSDSDSERNCSLAMVPRKKLQIALSGTQIESSQSIGLSFLLRFEQLLLGDTENASVFTISFQQGENVIALADFVIVKSSERAVAVNMRMKSEWCSAKQVLHFHEAIAVGLSFSKNGMILCQNGESVATIPAFPQCFSVLSLTLCATGKQTIILLTHLAIFTSPTFEEKLLSLSAELYRRFIPWKSLKAISVNGARAKLCQDPIASVQSSCRIARVRLWGETFFNGIEFVYERDQTETSTDPAPIYGTFFGNSIASALREIPTVEVTLMPFEFITEMSGHKGAWLDSITLRTNFKRTFMCGGSGGDFFKISSPSFMEEIRSIEFAVGDHLNDPIAFFGPVKAPEHAMARELDDLCRSLTDASKRALTLTAMQRYVENLCGNPTEPKYQRIRAGNPYFVESFGHLNSLQLKLKLRWCGFYEEESDGQVYYHWKEGKEERWMLYFRVYLLELRNRCE